MQLQPPRLIAPALTRGGCFRIDGFEQSRLDDRPAGIWRTHSFVASRIRRRTAEVFPLKAFDIVETITNVAADFHEGNATPRKPFISQGFDGTSMALGEFFLSEKRWILMRHIWIPDRFPRPKNADVSWASARNDMCAHTRHRRWNDVNR